MLRIRYTLIAIVVVPVLIVLLVLVTTTYRARAQSVPMYSIEDLVAGNCIRITNDSETTAASAIVFYRSETTEDGPQHIEVYSALAADSSYTFPENGDDDDSAVIVSLSTLKLSEIGSSHMPDDYVDMYLGEETVFNTLSSSETYTDFAGAFDTGSTWHEVELDDAYGPELTVEEVAEGCS